MSCLCSRKVSSLVPVEKEYVGSKNTKGQRHGKGRLTLQDGRVFTGHFKAGKALSGAIAYPNGDSFDGTISYSFSPVQGVFTWAAGPRAGCIYKGPFKEGLPHASRAIYVFANQTIYDGPFEDGHAHGQGIVKFSLDAPGDTFDGAMVRGAIDGPGRLVYKDGGVYVGGVLGTPEQGSLVRRHGQGTLTSANGDVYTGGFLDDKRQGRGVLLSSRGSGPAGAIGGGSARRRSFDAAGSERTVVPPPQLPVGAASAPSVSVHSPSSPSSSSPSPSSSASSRRRRSFDGAPSGKYSATSAHNNTNTISTTSTTSSSSSSSSTKSGSGSGGSDRTEKAAKYCYDGSWHDDRRHGRGKETQPQGGYYDGGWEADVRHGAGMYLYPDGRLYSIRYNRGEVAEMKMEADGSAKVSKAEKKKEGCGMS